MIYVRDNGHDYSAREIQFIKSDNPDCDAVVALLSYPISWYGKPKVLMVAKGIDFITIEPESLSDWYKSAYDYECDLYNDGEKLDQFTALAERLGLKRG